MDINLPDTAQTTSNPTEADIAILGSSPSLSRSEQRQFVESRTPLFFSGDGSEESLVAALYDLPKSDVTADRLRSTDTGFDLSHGIEYDSTSDSYQAAVVPNEQRDSIATYIFSSTAFGPGTTGAPTKRIGRKNILENIDKVLVRGQQKQTLMTASFGLSGTVTASEDPTEDGDCPDGWNCLGENQRATDVDYDGGTWTAKCGSIFKEVTGGVIADEDDSDTDYWGWKIQQRITPNDNNYFIATRMFREFGPYNDRIVRKAGPEKTNETTSTTISIGPDANESDSSVSVGWSWSSTSKEVSNTQKYFDTSTGVKNTWDISGDAVNQTVSGYPGYQVECAEGETSVTYNYQSEWEFNHTRYACNKTEVESGTGDWSK
ncbi:hypothetical protein BRC82_08300 [Halobacteriales archaeon QS_1_67_19]|nr:MAG: hypothetical protein BRC82_08300 [Halobacteriales archaeon QS_1_67_19]